ncbi:MAG: TetR/AcrR family transcriptional regulator [Gemmatimonadota bacterium]|jgi:TetR/AcrR family transcriptional regulator
MPQLRARPTASPHILKKRERRRTHILHSALRAFRRKGYHATTLDDIAEELGVRRTALYHYFPDKEAILYACHLEALAELKRILREARAEFDGARDRLRHIVREHVRVMTDTLEGSPLAIEVTELSAPHHAEVVAARDRYERGVRAIVEEGMRGGEFRAADPKIATFAILGAINWIARWYRPEGTVRASELGTQFADHLVAGLTGD